MGAEMGGYPAIIVDIDGTLADNNHRLHWIKRAFLEDGNYDTEFPDWDKYNNLMGLDTPIEPTCELVRTLAWHYKIILMTGRPETHLRETMDWLLANQIPHVALYMRPDADHTNDWELKEHWLSIVRAGGRYNVIAAIEDRQRVVDMWRKNDVLCLQCAKGDY